jgi:hypothetical protein
MYFKIALICLFFILSTGCQSSPAKAFDQVQIGSTKGPILSSLGNPRRTYRKGGVDRWVYDVPNNDGGTTEKELWFKDGIVVFKDGLGPNPLKGKPIYFEEIN